MLCAYYSNGCESLELFEDLSIAQDENFRQYLNQFDVLYLDITLFLSTMEPNEHLVDRIEEEIIKDLSQYYSIEIKENKLVDALRINIFCFYVHFLRVVLRIGFLQEYI